MTKPHEAWFSMAESDLNFAKVGLREKFYSQVCFLSQQAIEKTLKGYLVHLGRSYPKTHKLVDLHRLCGAKFLEPFKNKLKLIDEFYIPARYPDGIPGGLPDRVSSLEDAGETLKVAEEIMQACFSHVGRKNN
jgi:HEPN domain-containing protein